MCTCRVIAHDVKVEVHRFDQSVSCAACVGRVRGEALGIRTAAHAQSADTDQLTGASSEPGNPPQVVHSTQHTLVVFAAQCV